MDRGAWEAIQSIGFNRVGHDLSNNECTHTKFPKLQQKQADRVPAGGLGKGPAAKGTLWVNGHIIHSAYDGG